MELDDFKLRVLSTVAECGSFTDAARRLDVSQPAVSMIIRELEGVVGSKLLERKSGRTVPTEQGRLFLEYAGRILYWYDRIDGVFVKKTETPDSGLDLQLGGDRHARVTVENEEIKIKLI